MLKAKQALAIMEGDLGLICGDFNTTLDAKYDRYGYASDTHRKCRSTIQKWFNTGELIDAVRCSHPDSHLYSWRTKNFKRRVE